jgi:hypothetical protein
MSRKPKSNKMKQILRVLMFITVVAAFSSCTTINKSMREPNTKLNLNKSDFTLSDQVTAEATSTKIIGIDFARLFMKKTGTLGGSVSMASIPVIGNLIADDTENYALYNLMHANLGYDVVFYPQYETKVLRPFLGIGFITKITNVKTIARLGKLNK